VHIRLFALTVGASILVACGGGGGGSQSIVSEPAPAPSPLNQQAYVVIPAHASNAVMIENYNLPIVGSSSPNFALTLQNAIAAGCADRQGRLFVSGYMFAPPITQNSKPSFTDFSFTHLWTPSAACAFDSAGNLYVPEFGLTEPPTPEPGYVDVFAAPVQAGSKPIATLDTTCGPADGITTDANGDVFVVCGEIVEFSPRASGNTLLATFGQKTPNDGAPAIGPDGSLYALGYRQINAYPPNEFHDGGVADRTIPLNVSNRGQVTFDRAGDMLVITFVSQGRLLYNIPPPYAAPNAIVHPGNFGTNDGGNIALSP